MRAKKCWPAAWIIPGSIVVSMDPQRGNYAAHLHFQAAGVMASVFKRHFCGFVCGLMVSYLEMWKFPWNRKEGSYYGIQIMPTPKSYKNSS